MLRIFEDQKVSDFLRSVAATALNPKSFLPRDRLTHVNYAVRRTVRAAASAPRRPAIRTAHSRGLRRLRPEICAENLKKSPENTKITKKSMQIVVRFNYLYYFWGKRSVEMRRESRCRYR